MLGGSGPFPHARWVLLGLVLCLGCIFRIESFALLDFLACLEGLNLLIKTGINYSRTTGKEKKSLFFLFPSEK